MKYLSTVHPHFRDGLLKGNIEDLDEMESIFHKSEHQYCENRPDECYDQENIHYDEEELVEDYWINLCLAEFWSKYEIVYGQDWVFEVKLQISFCLDLIKLQRIGLVGWVW